MKNCSPCFVFFCNEIHSGAKIHESQFDYSDPLLVALFNSLGQLEQCLAPQVRQGKNSEEAPHLKVKFQHWYPEKRYAVTGIIRAQRVG